MNPRIPIMAAGLSLMAAVISLFRASTLPRSTMGYFAMTAAMVNLAGLIVLENRLDEGSE